MTVTRRITGWLASSRGLFLTAVLAGSLTGVGMLGIGEPSHVITAQFTDAEAVMGDVPSVGQHTDQVLAELGFGPEKIAAMRQAGVI